jgi:hypothetical protein
MGAIKEAKQEFKFQAGDTFEYRSSKVGLRGSWFKSKVSSMHASSVVLEAAG